ncbi:MAG: hypothetical protein RL199_1319 [Pseudomonadota bacterium]|jgi:formylglycine-generating enzyme required for sulfatase activity
MKRSHSIAGVALLSLAACIGSGEVVVSPALVATDTAALSTTVPPTGGRVTLGNAGTTTNNPALTLFVSASGVGAARVAEFCVAETAFCPSGNWVSLAVPVAKLPSYAVPFVLTPGDGPHVVRVWFKDDYGNITRTPATVRVVLDTDPPLDGTVLATPLNGGVRLAVSGASDTGTGVARYAVVASTGGGPPADCAGPRLTCTGDLTCRGLVNNQTYELRVCAVDKAGNVSGGVLTTVTPRRTLVPPVMVGASVQPPGRLFTAAPDTVLLVAARSSPGAAVVEFCAAEAPATGCPGDWTPVETPRGSVSGFEIPWSFSPGDGPKVVRVWARDDSMNVSKVAATVAFVVDTELPADGAVRILPEPDGKFTVEVTGASDTGSGIGRYLVGVNPDGSAASDCTNPLPCRNWGRRVLCPALEDGAVVTGAHVCVVDRAGNLSPGIEVVADPPAGSLVTKAFNETTVDFSYIPDGIFLMGAPASDPEAALIEKRQHYVTLTQPFLLSRTETTRLQWVAVTGLPTIHTAADYHRPIDRVTWDAAVSYCDAMSDLEGVERGTYGLPTEAQWEYAARAGSAASRWGRIEEIAWYNLNAGSDAHPVATRLPNAWGLFDMLGNVWEWTADWHGPYTSNSQTDPTGPVSGTGHVVRGGAWNAPAAVARVTGYRYNGESVRDYLAVGFRVRRTLP